MKTTPYNETSVEDNGLDAAALAGLLAEEYRTPGPDVDLFEKRELLKHNVLILLARYQAIFETFDAAIEEQDPVKAHGAQHILDRLAANATKEMKFLADQARDCSFKDGSNFAINPPNWFN